MSTNDQRTRPITIKDFRTDELAVELRRRGVLIPYYASAQSLTPRGELIELLCRVLKCAGLDIAYKHTGAHGEGRVHIVCVRRDVVEQLTHRPQRAWED